VPAELDFTAETVDGSTFEGRSLAGQDAVVYFWAPWCPVCRREAPGLAAVVADYPDLAFVTVGGSSQDRDAMAGFVADVGFDAFPNVADESGDVWTRFGVTYQYTYAFVDEAGTVELVTGPLDEADLRSRIDTLLAS
jgi:peroxiredoxin